MSARASRAAAALGRRGGRARSEAKAAAARANGARGGRPVKTITVGAGGGRTIEIHADAVWIGYTVQSKVALVARTPAAARWLKRRGYEYARWTLAEVYDPPEGWHGRCWA